MPSRVLVFGDSILLNGYPTNDPCTVLQAARSDLTVINASWGGRSTFTADLPSQIAATLPLAYVVINLGVNDPAAGETNAANSLARIILMATKVVAAGAVPVILTPTPAPLVAANGVDVRKFTRDLARYEALLPAIVPGTIVGSVRDEFLLAGWDNVTASNSPADTTHPNVAGRAIIGNYLAGLIPT